ncbi:MAG TPA: hypothetical protein VHO70_04450 [Chitinispirillaceae bacterium]|nr:hypothetical protein [Chitinispirillaceae bacterium]
MSIRIPKQPDRDTTTFEVGGQAQVLIAAAEVTVPCVPLIVLRSAPPVTVGADDVEITTGVTLTARKGREPAGIVLARVLAYGAGFAATVGPIRLGRHRFRNLVAAARPIPIVAIG